MDIVKERKKERYTGKLIAAGAVVFLAAVVGVGAMRTSDKLLTKGELSFAVPKKGRFVVEVEGFGMMRSLKQKVLTAPADGMVVQLILNAGAQVTPESTVMVLENPELDQQVESERQLLSQMEANLHQTRLQQQREKLNEVATLTDLEIRSEYASVKESMHAAAREHGVVSQLQFRESQLEKKRAEQIVALHKERLSWLDGLLAQELKIQDEKIAQQEGKLAMLEAKLTQMSVTAGIDGVVQRLSSELGQQKKAGEELALVGSTKDLVALLKIPQRQIEKVELGQDVEVDIRDDVIKGRVSRIEPTVTDNTVNVEVVFSEALPPTVHPGMSVGGRIKISESDDAIFVDRPVDVAENGSRDMYVYLPDSGVAMLRRISFGGASRKFIQVSSGLKENERLIVSGVDGLSDPEIRISE